MNYTTNKTVHIFPHSHTDLGWLSTVEEYFEGKNLDFYIGSINTMLTTVVEQLEQDGNKTFTYAEMKFFKMWWDRQTPQKRDSVRGLIHRGQLNIVNGGVSAPDEACTNHDDIIDNFMSGHRFLAEEVGVDEPKISW
mmetsp:Transcript_4442/g.6560  ORF Transcript_4442/g.6560 Transcript_4442/m.6560 type:complete len:137 (-) Transcript_4442:2874-3284(-)